MEEKNQESQRWVFQARDIVTMNPNPPFPPVSRDYVERLKSKKKGTVYGVDTKSTGEGEPMVSVRWTDIPNDVRPYPWWELKHAEE